MTFNISPARRDLIFDARDITVNEAIYNNSVETCSNSATRLLLPCFIVDSFVCGAVHPGSITRIVLSNSDHSRFVTLRQ